MNKVIYIKAHPAAVGKTIERRIPTGEIKKGIFGIETRVTETVTEWEQTGWSDCRIDGERLTRDIEEAVISLNAQGYEVQSVTPVISGNYSYQYKETGAGGYPGGYGYGYGYSFTEGVTIIAKKTTQQ